MAARWTWRVIVHRIRPGAVQLDCGHIVSARRATGSIYCWKCFRGASVDTAPVEVRDDSEVGWRRRVIRRLHADGFTHREISAVLSIGRGVIRRALDRADDDADPRSVRQQRRRLEADAHTEWTRIDAGTVDWDDPVIADMLGLLSDGEVAARVGRTHQAVAQARRRRGIPALRRGS